MPNLILVHQTSKQDIADYIEIRRQVSECAEDISVYIVDTKEENWTDREFDLDQPTLTVSPMPIKKFLAPRGTVCQGYEFPKGEQYERMARVGVSVPDWTRVDPGISLDPEEWGPYVVVKPELGRKGAEIFIKRTGRVRYKPPGSYPEGHPVHKAPLLAQRFIYTGKWPVNYRVVTLFGNVLLCWRCEANHEFVPLNSRWDFKAKGGITVVSNKRDSNYTLADDQDVINLAEKAHLAFPEQPLLGTDIVRDADSGELYVIECNPRGDAWLISSVMGRAIEQANGLNFSGQFDALKISAATLVRETLQRAN